MLTIDLVTQGMEEVRCSTLSLNTLRRLNWGRYRNAFKPTLSEQVTDGLPAPVIPATTISHHVKQYQENIHANLAVKELFADRSAITELPAAAWSLESLLGCTSSIPAFDQFPDPVALGVLNWVCYSTCVRRGTTRIYLCKASSPERAVRPRVSQSSAHMIVYVLHCKG